jgi:hypothetical protein
MIFRREYGETEEELCSVIPGRFKTSQRPLLKPSRKRNFEDLCKNLPKAEVARLF